LQTRHPGIAAPTVTSDRAHVQLHGTLSVNAGHGVLANDTDPIPNDTLIVSAVNGQGINVGHAVPGTFGTLTLNADGSYSYSARDTAAHDFNDLPRDGVGEDIFTYTAKDGPGGIATTTLTIVVTQSDITYLGGTAGTTIHGGTGKQVLDGGAGNDVLVAGKGTQVLLGGSGDTLTGGNGHDTFVFAPNFGMETITNFNAHLDKIQLPRSEFANFDAVLADAHQLGANTVITYDANDVITLNNVALNHLHASDFHLV
jgi:VCBS repeat-containing protein